MTLSDLLDAYLAGYLTRMEVRSRVMHMLPGVDGPTLKSLFGQYPELLTEVHEGLRLLASGAVTFTLPSCGVPQPLAPDAPEAAGRLVQFLDGGE